MYEAGFVDLVYSTVTLTPGTFCGPYLQDPILDLAAFPISWARVLALPAPFSLPSVFSRADSLCWMNVGSDASRAATEALLVFTEGSYAKMHAGPPTQMRSKALMGSRVSPSVSSRGDTLLCVC